MTGAGVSECWEALRLFAETMHESGEFDANRRRQAVQWMHRYIADRLRARFYDDPEVRRRLPELEAAIAAGTRSPIDAAEELLQRYDA